MKKLLALSGSSRRNSLNTKLLQIAVKHACDQGAEVEILDLGELDLPIYHGDEEEANGLPAGAVTLKNAMRKADGFLIASPEYNSFPTPLLLNAIDWASRPESSEERPLSAFKGKGAGLMAASPGPLGGMRSLSMLRAKLQNIGVTVVPGMTAVGSASTELLSGDDFINSGQGNRLKGTITSLIQLKVQACDNENGS